MPQESIYYAIGRLSVMQKNTLDASKLERLLQAPTAQEARRTLSEMGWSAEGDYDRIAAQHVENACRLIREIATDEEEIDCFLLKYDDIEMNCSFSALLDARREELEDRVNRILFGA